MLAITKKTNIHSFTVLKFALSLIIAVCISSSSFAQNNNNNEAVGGIRIDAKGVLQNNPINLSDDIRQQINQSLKTADADMNKSGLRVFSLRKLEQAMLNHNSSGQPMPPALKYMAGLQRIEYVMISPNGDDILIAGPGEGLTTNKEGMVVGSKSGMPAIQLQDFLVAMRSVQNARTGKGITVSIDPTEDGVRNVQKLMKRMTPNNFNPNSAKALEEACGPQNITLTGVPKDSRFSNVLVAADYKMKRLAMGLEPAPVFLPSLLAVAQQNDVVLRKMSPRFWMEANYEPIAVSTDKKVWKLNGQGVCTKTMEEVNGREKANKYARAWASKMTKEFDNLAQVQPVFRELRNLMDISVVAAIIAREQLFDKVGLQAPAINGYDMISIPKWNVPEKVPTQCSYARLTRAMLVTTSGGVTIRSWSVASNTVADSKLGSLSQEADKNRADHWWWNVN